MPLAGPILRALVERDRFLLDRVLTGGDDYQVLAAVPPEQAGAFESAAMSANVRLTRVGCLTQGGVRITGTAGEGLGVASPAYGALCGALSFWAL